MDAQAAVAQGASAIHVHVRDESGQESLDPDDVGQSVEAIRRACPGIPVSISTGAWIVPALQQRLALIGSWSVLPDCASVNLHEAGAADVMRALLDKGIGVEAGIWNAPAAVALILMFNNLVNVHSDKLGHGPVAPNYDADGMKITQRWWFA